MVKSSRKAVISFGGAIPEMIRGNRRSGARDKKDAPKIADNLLVLAVVSATARLVLPVFGLFFVGLVIDFVLAQPAFYAVVGAGVGFVAAAFLIYLQIRNLNKNGHDKLIDSQVGIKKVLSKNARHKIADKVKRNDKS